jgi:hypothetical protein
LLTSAQVEALMQWQPEPTEAQVLALVAQGESSFPLSAPISISVLTGSAETTPSVLPAEGRPGLVFYEGLQGALSQAH